MGYARAGIALAILASSACSPAPTPIPAAVSAQERGAVLTKDEALRIDGQPVTLSSYRNLRAEYPELASEDAGWAVSATIALILSSRTQASTPILGRDAALRIVRYALGLEATQPDSPHLHSIVAAKAGGVSPAVLRNWLDGLLSRSVIEKNKLALAELR